MNEERQNACRFRIFFGQLRWRRRTNIYFASQDDVEFFASISVVEKDLVRADLGEHQMLVHEVLGILAVVRFDILKEPVLDEELF